MGPLEARGPWHSAIVPRTKDGPESIFECEGHSVSHKRYKIDINSNLHFTHAPLKFNGINWNGLESQNFQRLGASRDLFATAELLVYSIIE